MIDAVLMLTSILAISSSQSQPANHDLDFWVGSWNVYVDNTLAGHDVVEKSLDGYVIIERWEGGEGDKGMSFFYYMPAKKQWKQIWSTEIGVYKEKFSEPFKDGIRFSGNVFLPNGKSIPDRTTLTALPDGTVRQVIEQARDGKTWKSGFDAIYKRADSRMGQALQDNDKEQIEAINKGYVASWLRGDKDGVLRLFENDAVITPSGMAPLRGIKEVSAFWFPIDGSKTRIKTFDSTILSIHVDGDFATSTQKIFLSWTYEKGQTKQARDQWGHDMTTYHRQANGGWKIWRQVWTDYKIVDKNPTS